LFHLVRTLGPGFNQGKGWDPHLPQKATISKGRTPKEPRKNTGATRGLGNLHWVHLCEDTREPGFQTQGKRPGPKAKKAPKAPRLRTHRDTRGHHKGHRGHEGALGGDFNQLVSTPWFNTDTFRGPQGFPKPGAKGTRGPQTRVQKKGARIFPQRAGKTHGGHQQGGTHGKPLGKPSTLWCPLG